MSDRRGHDPKAPARAPVEAAEPAEAPEAPPDPGGPETAQERPPDPSEGYPEGGNRDAVVEWAGNDHLRIKYALLREEVSDKPRKTVLALADKLEG